MATTPTYFSLPTTLGRIVATVDGEDDLCLSGFEADLLSLGATITGGCTSATAPSSSTTSDAAGTEVDTDEPSGETTSGQPDCYGGGTFQWFKHLVLKVDTSSPAAGHTPGEQYQDCFDKALASVSATALSYGRTIGQIVSCTNGTCTGECEEQAGVWDRPLTVTIAEKGRQIFNAGTSTEHLTISWEISVKAQFDFTVECHCKT